MNRLLISVALVAAVTFACGTEEETYSAGPNPFLEDQANHSKEDTQYVNPDGIEVEVDIEADIEAPSYKIDDGPAILGQFAMTYLRKRGDFYLESLAEDATSDERVEWRVDGEWFAAGNLEGIPYEKLTHFRIRGINAVLLHHAVGDAVEGKQYLARVPKKPFSIMADAGDRCADPDSHMTLSQSIYWYQWNPDRSGCDAELSQDMLLTVSKMLPTGGVTYPEYDQLIADSRITAVVLFGKIGDGDIERDIGMYGFNEMADWLEEAGFGEVTPAPVGRRFLKNISGIEYEIDLYSPKDFSGLSDYSNYDNFEKAVTEHEIVVYDGHSMMGSSDFWAKPDYPDYYQIFIYGGCLGYEYYVKPVLDGKGGWDKVDIVSSVIEVSVGANYFAGPFLAKLAWAIDHNYNVSWKDMLIAIRKKVGDSTFGVCGATENCFSPAGSLCDGEGPAEGETRRFESTEAIAIPDNDAAGIASVLQVDEELGAINLAVEVDISHSYVGDLRIILDHDGAETVLWDKAGGNSVDLNERFALPGFAGKKINGTWTLKVFDTYAADTGTLNSWAVEVLTEATVDELVTEPQ